MAYIILMMQVQQVQVFSVAVKILKRKVWQRQLECEHAPIVQKPAVV